MAKFLIFIAVLALVYWLVQASNRRSKPPGSSTPSDGTDAMAQCAHCGVHFPAAESSRDGERDYCCPDHRRLGVRTWQ